MVKMGLFKTNDSLIPLDEHLATFRGNGYSLKDKNKAKTELENGIEREKSKSNSKLKSEDFSDIESECDVPVCDNFITFWNPLFDVDDDFSSSDDESFSDEDISKEIYSNPLFDEEIISTKIDPHHFNAESDLIESLLNQDTSIISSPKIDSLLEEFSVFDAVIESFSPSPIPVEDSDFLMAEIDLFLTPDESMPPGIENDDYDFEGDILFLEELLSKDSPSLPENESFHFDFPSSHRPHCETVG
ncbi:hypothetical protein Tco_0654338 [Tanacetum coccineum]|uniref:Reverse transcriptase domain-containing protein n=1 Tax=Tanacetum coccineum TaxID=301880 RepID=A0ABQ4X2X1_9ASTR